MSLGSRVDRRIVSPEATILGAKTGAHRAKDGTLGTGAGNLGFSGATIADLSPGATDGAAAKHVGLPPEYRRRPLAEN
jgi:hypothetical protein